MPFFYKKPEDFRGKRVLVMGLGLHGGGVGAAKWLMRHGAKVTITDLKSSGELKPSIKEVERAYRVSKQKSRVIVYRPEYIFGEHREKDFLSVDLIIVNPGVPRESRFLAAARKASVPIDTDVGIFFRLNPHPVIAVTGTKGKTTTTALTSALVKKNNPSLLTAGNIRVSVMDALDALLKKKAPRKAAPQAVLELSSWQLEGLEPTGKSPHIAVLTNVLEDHLNRYKGMDDYIHAKEIIFAFQKRDDFAVVNYDNSITRAIGAGVKSKRFWFTTGRLAEENGVFIKNGDIIFRDSGVEQKLCSVSNIQLLGKHNLENVLAAVTVAGISKISPKGIRRVIRNFTGLPGRLEVVRKWRGITFINDTTATTPDAVIAALHALASSPIVLIAGGQDKNLRFDKMAAAITKHVKALVLLDGSATDKVKKLLARAKNSPPMIAAQDMRTAVKKAAAFARRGDLALLSPGAASFGLFKHEFDRGEQFVKCVKNLK